MVVKAVEIWVPVGQGGLQSVQATRGPAASGSVVLSEGVQVLGIGQEEPGMVNSSCLAFRRQGKPYISS